MSYGQEMCVDSVQMNVANSKRVLVLKHKTDRVYVPIWINTNEAEAIAFKLSGNSFNRPMTHDLFANSLKKLGCELRRVEVNKLVDDTLFALLYVKVGQKELVIDSRPSDAIALAVRAGARIFVADEVYDQVGVPVDEQQREEAKQPDVQKMLISLNPLGNREREQLEPFNEFVRTLNLGHAKPKNNDPSNESQQATKNNDDE